MSLDHRIERACYDAMRSVALTIDLTDPFDRIVDNRLRDALAPLVGEEGRGLDQLLEDAKKVLRTDSTLSKVYEAARQLDTLQRASESRLRGLGMTRPFR